MLMISAKLNFICNNLRYVLLTRQLTNAVSDVSASWFKAVKNDDVDTLKSLLTDESTLLNLRDKRGWTALMHGAKHGNLQSSKFLLQNGCRASSKTRSGQTALEIAALWGRKELVNLLNKGENYTFEPSIYFTHNPINRNAQHRGNDAWLLNAMKNLDTKFILMHRSKPVVIESTGEHGGKLQLLSCNILQVHEMIDDQRQNLVFLGTMHNGDDSGSVSDVKETACFAIDISTEHMKAVEEQQKHEGHNAHALIVYPGVLQLSPEEAAIVAQARSLFDWHFRYSYCPTCGSKTSLVESGYKRICQDATCLSHTGVYNTNYPRTDPTVITAIVSRDSGPHCLLARKRSFPPGMFTCIAGFVEPGESVEMACQREVSEEVGVEVDRVEYIASQPWPMPNALMLGCLAYTQKRAYIKLDEKELETARWFPREEVVQMLTATHPDRLFLPPPEAIAHQLVKLWALRTAYDA